MTEDVFRFAGHAAETFALGDIQTKREIFNALDGKFVLKDRTLSFEQEPWFKKISEEYPVIQQQLQEVRNKKITNLYLEMVEIGNILQNWYATRPKIGTPCGLVFLNLIVSWKFWV